MGVSSLSVVAIQNRIARRAAHRDTPIGLLFGGLVERIMSATPGCWVRHNPQTIWRFVEQCRSDSVATTVFAVCHCAMAQSCTPQPNGAAVPVLVGALALLKRDLMN
jgi:hypothetical protein